jgi:hypothetical protein
LETLARLFVAGCDLLEAEGRLCKRQIVRLLSAVGLGFMVVALILSGLGMVLGGVYVILSGPLTPAGGAVTLGIVMLVLGLVGIAIMKRLVK